jgi:hypothetical protein
MTENSKAFWDDLGFAWQVAEPERGLIVPRLSERLRRQSLLIALGIAGGVLLAGAGALLGAFTLWIGWSAGAWNFIPRGIAILAISTIVALATASLWPVRASDNARALPDMLQLTVGRLAGTLRIIQLGLVACFTAAVLGLLGAAVRMYFFRAPTVSPVLDLALLAAVAIGLALYRKRVSNELLRFRYLQEALSAE